MDTKYIYKNGKEFETTVSNKPTSYGTTDEELDKLFN
jgi:hypothetical protein